MLREARFDSERRSVGLEIELNLTDEQGDPAMVNARALEAIADADFQTELGQFNVEINVPPRLLEGSIASELEEAVRGSLNRAEERSRTVGAHMMLIGILPTVTDRHLTADSFSENPRYELLEENVRYFPALLRVCEEEDPVDVLERGDTPSLPELRLHNGTVYRWNRPIYDVVRERPHLRVENRILPSGPSVADIAANAAFYYGLIRTLVEEERPLWSRMSFSAAEDNFHAAARDGIDARIYWPGVGEVPAGELVLRRLLPAAHEGLTRAGIEAADRDRLLGIVERRCVSMQNGAAWQTAAFHRLYDERKMDRLEALRRVTGVYREHMHANEPRHEGALP